MAYQLQGEDGSVLDARFEVDGNTIVFHSQSGGRGVGGRNWDYSRALRLLFLRLGVASLQPRRAWVDSSRVQSMPISERTILDDEDLTLPLDQQLSRMFARMKAVGRDAATSSSHGNHTKRIRLELPTRLRESEVIALLKAVSEAQEPAVVTSSLDRVTAEHLWEAAEQLASAESHRQVRGNTPSAPLLLHGDAHLLPETVLREALRLATRSPGKRPAQPFDHSKAVQVLTAAGFNIVTGNDSPRADDALGQFDIEWSEGAPQMRRHLYRERASGLREAKKAEFRRRHEGKLFCERCGEDPVEKYGTVDAVACIEVHHRSFFVADMPEGHKTRLEDLQCLCANCHRIAHRELRRPDAGHGPVPT